MRLVLILMALLHMWIIQADSWGFATRKYGIKWINARDRLNIQEAKARTGCTESQKHLTHPDTLYRDKYSLGCAIYSHQAMMHGSVCVLVLIRPRKSTKYGTNVKTKINCFPIEQFDVYRAGRNWC